MAATVMVLAGVWVAPLLAAAAGSPQDVPSITCAEGSVTTYEIKQPGSVVLKCPTGYTKWVPALTNNAVTSVGTTETCTSSTPLNTLCPGASGSVSQVSPGKANDTASALSLTFTITQLPTSDSIIYMACHKGDKATEGCGFALKVRSSLPQGPQACAVAGSTVNLGIVDAGGKTQFKCGGNYVLNPTDPKKVFQADCTKMEDLKNLTLTPGTDGYYTLTSTKKQNKQVCYLCSPSSSTTKGKASDNCAILIDVSAGSGHVARSMFGMALSCTLALLHFA